MNHTTTRTAGSAANALGGVFYGGVALVALAGQTGAAVHWLGWHWTAALPAVALLELGGIALAARADFRRRLGENAYAARTLSAAVAIFAIVFNWVGHSDHLQGGFFAGMSALGYAVWLINAEDRRRDQLRAAGMLPPPSPVYGLWQWARHPWITRRARALAKADPRLGLYGSLDAASAAVHAERRNAALVTVLRDRITDAVGDDLAKLAVHTYDLERIAREVREAADYPALARLIASDLAPARLAGQHTPTASPAVVSHALANPVAAIEQLAALGVPAPVSAPPSTEVRVGAFGLPTVKLVRPAKRDVRATRVLTAHNA